MNFELALITLAVWFFLAKKFSNWSWVKTVTDTFPRPLHSLWSAWMTCSFCGGFWIALALRGITGWQTLPALSDLHLAIDWTLDALATAMLATLVALPLELIASHVKKFRTAEEKSISKPHSQRPPSSQRPPQSSQRPRNPSPQRPQGQQKPSGRPSGGRPSGRNFQQGRPPRRPDQGQSGSGS